MTHFELKNLIDNLNSDTPSEFIKTTLLQDNVYYASVLLKDPKEFDYWIQKNPYKIYFIKNIKDVFVGAVVDMGEENLHWFVLEEYRKKGTLTNALKDVILNHLFLTRENQAVILQHGADGDYHGSEQILINLGFTKVSDIEYHLNKANKKETNFPLDISNKITMDDYERIKKKINYFSISLKFLRSEIEIKKGGDLSIEYLDDIISNLNFLKTEVHNNIDFDNE